MSRPRSMFSRMRVELMSSRWVGSCSWMMLPEMQPRSRVDLPSLRVAGAAEDDVVHGVDGPRHRCRLVGGGVGYHVRAHRQVQLPAGKDLPQPVQVLRRGQVHRDVVGEEVHVELVRHGHADDLPPHQGEAAPSWTRRTRRWPGRPPSPGPGSPGRCPCGSGRRGRRCRGRRRPLPAV